jgi:tetratricopeptide (TPR) repeat protein
MYRGARTMLEELGQGVLAASTSTDSAPVEVLAGDLPLAAEQLRRDDATLQALGETYLRATVAGLLAGVLVAMGEVSEAERASQTTRELSGPDDVDAQVLWRASLGRCRAIQRRMDEAISLTDEAVALTEDVSAPMLRAQALTDRAAVRAAAGRPDEARDDLAAAIALHEAKGNRLGAEALRTTSLDPAR